MMSYVFMWAVFLVTLVLDQVTKYFAYRDQWAFDVFGLSWFRFETVMNEGIAFSLPIKGALWWVLFFVIVIVFSRTVYHWYDWKKRPCQLAAGLLLGGALGNILDRVFRGAVVDYIQVGWWPSFNVADSAICISVAVLLLFCHVKPSSL